MTNDYSQLTQYAATDTEALKKELSRRFEQMYGTASESIAFFAAPARINIIGEHIDYNGGKVFPTAIDKYIYLAIRKRQDTVINYDDIRFPGRFSFNITDAFRAFVPLVISTDHTLYATKAPIDKSRSEIGTENNFTGGFLTSL